MNPHFQPLISKPSETETQTRPFALKVVSAEQASVPFKPLSSMLTPGGNGAGMGGVQPGQPEASNRSKLEVKRDANRISRLTVNCGCGRVHEVDLEY
ncbi:MAG TPA: hypothetical protein DCY13_12235 [Verrucomicrobiales bacterium]|nr:hypothetical protein [Verrucomicrobiales bacterium]